MQREGNAFDVLANRWEEESRRCGFAPGHPSPRHVARRRIREIIDLLERGTVAQEATGVDDAA